MTPTLTDLYRADLATLTATNDRKTARRYWLRAVIEELNERSLSAQVVPVQKTKKNRVERCRPFWRGRSDDDLFDLLRAISPAIGRKEHRRIPL